MVSAKTKKKIMTIEEAIDRGEEQKAKLVWGVAAPLIQKEFDRLRKHYPLEEIRFGNNGYLPVFAADSKYHGYVSRLEELPRAFDLLLGMCLAAHQYAETDIRPSVVELPQKTDSPWWADECCHDGPLGKFLGRVSFTNAPYDVYVYQYSPRDTKKADMHLCIRYGNKPHEYASPGPVSSYMRSRVIGDGLSEKVRPLVQEWLDKQHEPG